MMGLRQCVLGVLLLVAVGYVISVRPKARSFSPRGTMKDPQMVGLQFGGQWDTLQSPHEVHVGGLRDTLQSPHEVHVGGQRDTLQSPHEVHFGGQRDTLQSPHEVHVGGQRDALQSPHEVHVGGQRDALQSPHEVHFGGQRDTLQSPHDVHFGGQRDTLQSPHEVHFGGQRDTLQSPHEVHFGGQWNTLQSPHEVQSLMPQLIQLDSNLAPSSVQSKQEMETPVDSQLTWKFPTVTEKPAQPDINFQLPHPHLSNSVAVQCLESGVHVEVKQDFFVSGQLLEPNFFSLGDCGVVDVDTAARVMIFQSALQECGSQLTVTEDELVYVFAINYKPATFQNIPIARSTGATVAVECHYPRKHNVSSNALQPDWIPYASTVVAEDILVFSLKLMTDDWMHERPSNVYYLGDIFNIQASLKQYNHVPLRIFVDYCVATATPDVNSAPMYSFIENHGCLTDAKYTGSVSKFLPRVQDDKLQFQLESFRFQQEPSGSHVYITCLLKGIVISSHVNEEHKSCSYETNGWVSADGSDQVCTCCDTSCGRATDHVFPVSGFQDVGKIQVGPLQIWDDNHSTKTV